MHENLRNAAMLRFTSTVVAAIVAIALLEAVFADGSAASVQAASNQQQEPPDEQILGLPTPTPLGPIGLLSPTVGIEDTDATTVTVVHGAVPEQQSATSAGTPATQDQEPDQSQPLGGTIISNRTNYGARFFLEGQVYRIGPFGSAGLDLARDTAVLNLFTCDAATPETQDNCYWDPYLLQRDGFYEVFDESAVVGLPILTLRDAGAPPGDQVWIHNRTGITESVVFRDIVHTVAPGAVQEFDVEVGAPVILYVRSCGSVDDEEACEWAPTNLEPGAYFAMVEVSTPGGIPGSRITTVDLRPVLDTTGSAIAAPAQVICDLRVPTLNIRSGPGLQYEIVGKIRGTDTEAGSVAVTAHSADGLWYAVAETVAENGWVTGNPDFIQCRTNTEDLPIAEFTGAPLAPTPVPTLPPVVEQPQPEVNEPAAQPAPVEQPDVAEVPAPEEPLPEEQAPEEPIVDDTGALTPTEETAQTGIPEGLAMLVVNNGFQYPIRFTVDQSYRPIEGPSEFDLEPGASTNVIVFPGTVAFTASSPWNGLSGNADITIDADQSAVLWLRFEAEPDDSSQWNLAWN